MKYVLSNIRSFAKKVAIFGGCYNAIYANANTEKKKDNCPDH